MKNKRTLIHFTLAVGLIVGIFITAKSNPKKMNKSNYSSYQKTDYVKSSKTINDLDSVNNKAISKVKETDINLNDLNNSTSSETIADIRLDFDVTDSDQVKRVQRILNLEEDGIFGPKTNKAYQIAIAKDNLNKSSTLNAQVMDTNKKSENLKGITTNATDSDSNAMLD